MVLSRLGAAFAEKWEIKPPIITQPTYPFDNKFYRPIIFQTHMYCYGEIRTTADKIGGNGKLRRVYIFDFFSAKLAFLLQMWNECGSCEGLLAREETERNEASCGNT